MYSFQVWDPDQDVLNKIQNLEHSCRNDSWQLKQQLLQVQLQLQDERFQIENVSNRLEKSLLAERLQQAQLGGVALDDIRLDLRTIRNENDKLWDAYRTISNSIGDGGSELELLEFPSSSKQISRLREDLTDMEDFLSQVKRGVGDLKGEWLVIKREVHNVNMGNSQIKMGQNALRDDTVKLKEMIEELRSDTVLLKDQQSEMKETQDKVTKAINDMKQSHQQTTISDWGSIPDDLFSLQEMLQDLSREMGEMKRQAAESKKEVIAVALAARNVSKEEIGQWLQKLPALQVPPIRPVLIAAPRGMFTLSLFILHLDACSRCLYLS